MLTCNKGTGSICKKYGFKTLYPNLAEYYAYGMESEATFATWANITEDIFKAVLYNKEPLTEEELKSLEAYSGISALILEYEEPYYMDPKGTMYVEMIENLDKALNQLEEYKREGEKTVIKGFDSEENTAEARAEYFKNRFQAGKGTYAEYIARVRDVEYHLNRIKVDRNRAGRETTARSASLRA